MPMIESRPDALAQNYARSLFDLASATGGQALAEQVAIELDGVLTLAREDKQIGEFFASRVIGGSKKAPILERVLKGRVSDLTYQFLAVLNSNDRLARLPSIVETYDGLVQNAFGRIEVDVHTAAPLDDQARATLVDRLRAVLKREPVLHAYVDPRLIGGVRLQIGDQLIDGSISSRLRRLREQLDITGLPAVKAAFDRLLRPDPGVNGH